MKCPPRRHIRCYGIRVLMRSETEISLLHEAERPSRARAPYPFGPPRETPTLAGRRTRSPMT
jgi:hypothetical protein